MGFGLSFSCFKRIPVYMLVGLEQISSQSRVVGSCVSLESPAPTQNVSKDATWTNTSASHPGTGRSAWDDEQTSLSRLVDDLCQLIVFTGSHPIGRAAAQQGPEGGTVWKGQMRRWLCIPRAAALWAHLQLQRQRGRER